VGCRGRALDVGEEKKKGVFKTGKILQWQRVEVAEDEVWWWLA